jgi:transcriptional regulator with XRE-family HTH domain/anti-sigma regulatory factor (Ser/Thr protein kinase)
VGAAEVVPLGARLRQRREELGLSQAQAARELEVARTAYRLWEMEAARPAPDRWRSIAKWLGMSMVALLRAGELLDQVEVLNAERAATAAGKTEAGWDDESSAFQGDYFSQHRALIDEQASAGNLSAIEATELRDVLRRIQDVALGESVADWHPGRFVKRFASTPHAPALARAGLAATAVGIPVEAFDRAVLLISELVTNSVRHAGSEWIEVEIELSDKCLRMDVVDQSRETIRPRTRNGDGGWGLVVLTELATRWGVERSATGKKIWVELDLVNS